MKNIHILPTDKPSRLYLTTHEYIFESGYSYSTDECQNKHIYITNNEEIKEGDYYYLPRTNSVYKCNEDPTELNLEGRLGVAKIILTTDPTLIADGVQAIDDKFLEWFVKNPSCEEVGIEPLMAGFVDDEPSYYENMYDIIIPKEEPKQETLEEASETAWNLYEHVEGNLYSTSFKNGFKLGAEWLQDKKMYSEEDMKSFGDWCRNALLNTEYSFEKLDEHLKTWEQIRNK
jgi:hypothetical protein